MVTQASSSARRVRRSLEPMVVRAAAVAGADRYRKRFPAVAHIWMLLLHVLHGLPSLRQTHAALEADTRLGSRLRLPGWISYSQFARSSTSRPSDCFERLLSDVARAAPRRAASDPSLELLRKVQAMGSSFIGLSAKLSPWSRHKGFKPGVRVQCLLDVAAHIPEHLQLTLADTNDHTSLWRLDLDGLRGWTLLFDLGYYGHRQFGRLRRAGVSFVSRLNEQASCEATARRRVPRGVATPEGDRVLKDETIRLGSPDNRRGEVLEGMRLVTYKTSKGETFKLVTDRFDLSAPEVVALYRKRWQIELFFRWLKRTLGAIRPFGHSPRAVWLTVLISAIVSLLMLLAESARPPAKTRVSWMRSLAHCLQSQLVPGG